MRLLEVEYERQGAHVGTRLDALAVQLDERPLIVSELRTHRAHRLDEPDRVLLPKIVSTPHDSSVRVI